MLRYLKVGKFTESEIAHVVSKKEIAKNGDYSLSRDRYRNQQVIRNINYPIVKVGEVMDFEHGKPLKKEDRKNGSFPVYGSNGIVGCHDEFIANSPFIVVGRKGSAGHYTILIIQVTQ